MTARTPAHPRGVIIDFDGVVAQSTDIKYALLLASARAVGMTDLDPLIAALDSELSGADRARVGRWVGEQLQDPGAADGFVDHFTAQFAPRSAAIEATAGFVPFIEALQRNDIRACLVSLAPVAEITSWLGAVLDPAVFAGIFGVEDGPKNVTTRLALDRMGVRAGSVVCIGDSTADLVAASDAGCRFVRLRSRLGDRGNWSGVDVPTAFTFTQLLTTHQSEFGGWR